MARTMWSPGILWACGVRLVVEGEENVDTHTPHIFVSNHCSYLDIPVLFRAIPSNLYFIAKKEIKWIPFIGQYMIATGMLFVNRSNRHKAIQSLKKAATLIHNGRSVLMFPEGTRSRDGKLAAFKKGPFHLALQAEVSTIPIGVTGTEKVLGPSQWVVRPGKVTVKIGKALAGEDYPELSQLQKKSWESVEKLIKNRAIQSE